MKKEKVKRRKIIFDLFLCAGLMGQILVYKYIYEVMAGDLYRRIDQTLILFPIFTLSLFVLLRLIQRLRKPLIAMTITVLCGALVGAWLFVYAKGAYEEMMVYQTPDTKKELYEGKKVLLLVPHQDDDINVLGGVIEEYTRYGSELVVVYSTNGDFYGQQDIRQQEAYTVLTALGVQEKNILFLGYGDGWKEKHIYHGEEGEVLVSNYGEEETYGPGEAAVYREGRAYTRENLKEDLKAVILEQEPDIIYCVDYDKKDDHRALSLLFEEIAGELLQDGAWKPVIMKGFAYTTAWFAEKDFMESKNLTETKNPDGSPYMTDNHTYLWEERVRMPICAASVSRRLIDSRLYDVFKEYYSQWAYDHAEAVINSDKVFWYRDTNSLSYQAQIDVSSGEGNRIHDFRLIDSSDIVGDDRQWEGTWIPDETDERKEIIFTFAEPKNIRRVVLYDNPSIEDNVLNAVITFGDGSSLETGELMKNGSKTEFVVQKENIESLTVKLVRWEGDRAGFTEIEVYDKEPQEPFSILKIVDEEGNFVYDHIVDKENLIWGLYTWGLPDKNAQNDYEIIVDNRKCSGTMENGRIKINCPKGETCVLTVRHRESGLEDSVRIRHLSALKEYQVKEGARIYQYWKNNLAEQKNRYGGIRESRFWGSVLLMVYSNIRNPM